MQPYLGEIRMVGFNFAPQGWALCDGHELPVEENQQLYQLLGNTYGGDGPTSFALPDLQGRIPIGAGHGDGLSDRALGQPGGAETVGLTTTHLPSHSHALVASQDPQSGGSPAGSVLAAGGSVELYTTAAPEVPLGAQSIAPAGGSQPHDNLQPFLAVNFIIALDGVFPTTPVTDPVPFMGEIRLMASGVTPAGWATCGGQLMSIAQAFQLFSLLGTNFGGDGKATFGLPNLLDAVPMGAGQGDGLSARYLGDSGGSESVALLGSELPVHTHTITASRAAASVATPSSATTLAASQGGNAYARTTDKLAGLAGEALASSGGGTAHNNLQPYLALNYCVALQGEFPSRA